MRKPAFFLLFFIFLGGIAWGQAETFTWYDNAADDSWDDPSNWITVSVIRDVPVNGDNIIVHSAQNSNYPLVPAAITGLGSVTLDGGEIRVSGNLDIDSLIVDSGTGTISYDLPGAAVTVSDIVIASGSTLMIGGVHVSADAITNNGTLSLDGVTGQAFPSSAGGIVIFTGSGTNLAGISAFNDLQITGGARAASESISVVNVTISGGSLNANNNNFTVEENIDGVISNINVLNLTGGSLQNISFGAAVTIGALNQTGTGTVIINDALTITGHADMRGAAEINSNISAASVDITGTAEINANINTSGNQRYGDIVLGNVTRTFTSTSGSFAAAGNVTGTAGVIINASQGITMTNSGGGVALSTAVAASSVSLNNNQTGAAPANAVNFHTTQNAAVSGINNAGVFSVTANDLTVNGISAFRAVLSANTVTVNGSINVSSNGTGAANHSSSDAAIYIFAETLAGAAAMTPGISGQACVFLGSSSAYTGAVGGNHIHYHANGKHLVYGNGAVDPSLISFSPPGGAGDNVAAGTYVYIRSDINLGAAVNYSTQAGYNIYIIDVGNTAPANSRDVNFSSGGYVEIRGAYTSDAPLTLSGTEIRLNNNQANTAPAALDLPSFIITAPLVLYGGTVNPASIRAANGNISLAAINGNAAGANNLRLEVSGNTNTLTSGAIGAVTALGDIQAESGNSADGAVAFSAVNAKSYTQTGTGSSRFSGIQTYAGNFTFTGAMLTVNAALNAVDAVITNSGVFTLGTNAAITLSGNFSQNGAGTNSVASNITSANNAAGNTILFTAAVALAANAANMITFNAEQISTVRFNGAVTCSASPAIALTINGNAYFNGGSAGIGAVTVSRDANFSTAPVNAASVSVTMTSTVNTNINTVNNQSYAGMVLGAVQRTLTSTNGSVTATGDVTGTAGVTIYASQGITMTNSGAGAALSTSAAGSAVSLNNNETGNPSGSVNPANAVNFRSLNSVTIIAANASAAGGNINIEAGTIAVGNAGGAGITTAATGNVVLTSGTTVTQGGTINAANLTVNAASGITLNGANQISASASFSNSTAGNIAFVNNTAAATNLSFNASNSFSGGTINASHNNGTLNVNASGVTSAAGVITLSGSGGVTLNGNVNTGAGAAINLTSTGGAVSGGGVLAGTTLTASAANGITLNGANQISASASLTNSALNNIGFTNTSANLGLTAANNTRAVVINQTGNLTITAVSSNSLTLNVSGAITAAGANSVDILHITNAGGAVLFNNNKALVLDGINAGAGRNNVAISAAGSVTQTANLIINVNLLDITAGGSVLLPGTGNAANSADALKISAASGSGTIRFFNNRALGIQGINAANYNAEIVNANPINITGAVEADQLRLETNNAAAVNNDITISALMTINEKLTIICGFYTPADDFCGTITINNNISVAGTGLTGDVIVFEAGNIKNNAIISAVGKDVVINTDELDIYGTINAANVSISPRHKEISLVYYSGTPPAYSDTHFGNFLAVPVSGADNKNFSGYENVFFVNVIDGANREINVDAKGFIEFYTSNAYSNNSYAYNGIHNDHLILNAVNIKSYHANDGQTNVNLGSSSRFFILDENISIERGSLSITANGITLGGNTASAASNSSANLSLVSNAGTTMRAVNVSGNFTFSGSALSGALNNTIMAANAVITNSGVFNLPSGANMSLSGNFTQSGGGTNSVAADIITNGTGASVSFANTVVLTGDITLQNEDGNITIGSAISGAFALRVNSRGTAAFANTVNLADFTMNSPGSTDGNARFYNIQNYSGNFAFYGGELTADGVMTAGGYVRIANSGLLTTKANIVSDNGFTQLAASSGEGVIGGNITTQGAVITFVNNITLTSDVQLSTVSANSGGNISLKGVDGAGRNLTVSANTANIEVSGDLGGAGALGNIIVIRANNAGFSGTVDAVSFTQGAGSGTTIFYDSQNYSAGFSFTGANLTVNSALNTDTNNTNNDGAISVTNSGLFTVGVSGSIAPNGTSGTINVTGSTVNNGSIAAGPVAAPLAGNISAAITFGGNYASSAAGIITGSGATTPDIQFKADVVLGGLTLRNNRIVFSGSGIQQFSAAPPVNPVVDGNVLVTSGSEVRVSGSFIRQSDAKTLELRGEALPAAAAIFDVSGASWHAGAGGTPSNDFSGINGELILGAGSKLIAHNVNLTGAPAPSASFKVTNTNSAFLSAAGNVNISDNVTLDGGGDDHFPLLVLEMNGNGKQDLTTDLVLGSLHVMENSQTVLNTNALQAIAFRGVVKISAVSAPRGLDAGHFNIVMYSGLKGSRNLAAYEHNGLDQIYYARWEVTSVAVPSSAYPMPPFVSPSPQQLMDNFVFRQDLGKKVSFKRDPANNSSVPVFFEIAGNTMWQEFECVEEGAVVQFSRHPNHHTVLDNFLIGNAGKYVTITRLTGNGYNYPYEYAPSMGRPPSPSDANIVGNYALPVYQPPMDLKNSAEAERQKYWNINLVSRPNPNYRPLEGFGYVRIFFSHAYNQRIPVEAKLMNLDIFPYWREQDLSSNPPVYREGYFNFDWIELRKILYSFTEDYNGNGRLDRIRVQTNLSLNGNFSQFDVKVDGYKVDSSKGRRGYELVSEYTGTGAFDEDSFYIYIEEDPDIDGGNTPLWHIIRNSSLEDALTGTLVGDPSVDVNIKPFDTIPPRIAYSLTLPGHPQTYVRMSEPVVFSSVSGNTSFSGSERIDTTPPYTFRWQYFPYETNVQPVIKEMPMPLANLGIMLNWSSPFSVKTLAEINNIYGDVTSAPGTGYFRLDNAVDQGQRAMDWSDHRLDEAFFIFYQPPKYPLNWKYKEYAKVMGNNHLMSENLSDDEPMAATATGSVPIADVFMPPNKMLTVEMMTAIAGGNGDQVTPKSFASYGSSADDIVIRRITDALVSIPPGSVNSLNYFAWPVWAKHEEALNKDPFNDNDIFWGQKPTDTGIIWEFDGTKFIEAFYLEERGNIIMQTRVNTALGNLNLKLLWSTNVPEKLRFPKEAPVRGRSSGGLWIPGELLKPVNKLLYYFTPVYEENNINSIDNPGVNPVVNFPFFTYNFGKISGGNRVDFIYGLRINNIDSDMYIARLNAPVDTIPNNWYRLVRPFSFDIQDIRRQRGGVTILNNVINSANRESTYIRYHLTRPGSVTIQIYTLDGTLVKSIRRNEHRAAGEYTDPWDGTNTGGRPVARGMYFMRIVAPDIDEIRKIMVVK